VISVGLKVLKNKLSEYVRRAAGGETILITDRERVVAELVPPRSTRADDISDAVLAQLVREGIITPARSPKAPVTNPPPIMTLAELLEGLDADRADR
jgi:prevent-host-death family protein